MKVLYILLSFLFVSLAGSAQEQNPRYDQALAEKFGADDYGMKTYILVMLRTGENDSKDKEQRSKSFKGHMANIDKMVADGKLIVAGPFMNNEQNYRGLFILDVDNLDTAQVLLSTDPAIKEDYMAYELIPWYGPAALPEFLEASDKVWKIKP